MSAQITGGPTTIAPDAVEGYESNREGGTLVHPILGGAPDVTLRQAQLRAGKLVLKFVSATGEADSKTAEDSLSSAAVFTFSETSAATIGMRFVVPDSGGVRRALSAQTGRVWAVTVDFQEVPA